ncbi:Uncharacterised protein [uncultured archaeon]|nr:Uncharacterised protein [uncultured archaeon]
MNKKKVMDKNGQFFLIGAIVIIVVIVSIVTISNYTQKKDIVKLYDLGQELGIESQQVLDYGTYSQLDDAQMKVLMQNFIQNYVNYVKEEKNIYFVYGNKNEVNAIGYQQLSSEPVCIKLNAEAKSPVCGDGIVNQNSEECDDGNSDSLDGCSSECKLEKYNAYSSSEENDNNKCGDGIIDKSDGEYCDTKELNLKTCISLGFASGTLKCVDCGFDATNCIKPEEPECVSLTIGETQTFPAGTSEGISTVVIRIDVTEYQFRLKEGENFYFIIWQKIGGEKHVVTSEETQP